MKELGLLTDEEVRRLRRLIDNEYPYSGEVSFIPLAWATATLRKAFEEGYIYPDYPHPSRRVRAAMRSLNRGRTKSNAQYPTPVQIAFNALRLSEKLWEHALQVYFPFLCSCHNL